MSPSADLPIDHQHAADRDTTLGQSLTSFFDRGLQKGVGCHRLSLQSRSPWMMCLVAGLVCGVECPILLTRRVVDSARHGRNRRPAKTDHSVSPMMCM